MIHFVSRSHGPPLNDTMFLCITSFITSKRQYNFMHFSLLSMKFTILPIGRFIHAGCNNITTVISEDKYNKMIRHGCSKYLF